MTFDERPRICECGHLDDEHEYGPCGAGGVDEDDLGWTCMCEAFGDMGPYERRIAERRIAALLSASEPAETGEDEPSGREEILEAYADEVRRLDAGEPSVCVRCKRPIQGVIDLYRCAECGLAFHDHCIRAHFTDHRSPAPTAAEPVREAPTPETERLFEAVLYGVRCGRGAVNDAACESIAREVIAALATPEAEGGST